MGDVNGECRLTDACLPGYCRDDYARTGVLRFEQGEEIGNLLLPTGEVPRARGKLGRHGMARHGSQPNLFSRRDPTKGRLVREDRPLPFPHRGGFDSTITGSAQRIQADGGGILPATVAVKGQRQIKLKAFVGRALGEQPAQYRYKRPVPTGRQICSGPFLFRMQSQLAQPGRITLDKGTPLKICQWFPAPERQCLVHPVGSARHVLGIPQPPGLLNQSEKNQFVELVRPDLENVPAGVPRQGLAVGLAQHPPKTENMHPQPMQVFAPMLFVPTAIALHGAEEIPVGDRAVRLGQESREQQPALRTTDRDMRGVAHHLERSKNPKLHVILSRETTHIAHYMITLLKYHLQPVCNMRPWQAGGSCRPPAPGAPAPVSDRTRSGPGQDPVRTRSPRHNPAGPRRPRRSPSCHVRGPDQLLTSGSFNGNRRVDVPRRPGRRAT